MYRMCTVHRHNKKGSTRWLPPRRSASTIQLDLVSICHRSASSDRVCLRSMLRAKPLRSYMAQAYSVALRLNSDLPSRFAKPNATTCFHIVAWSRCFVPNSLGFSEPFCRLSRISFSVMCFWSHSVRVSKCLILPTPLLAPIPLAAEASPAMSAARSRPTSRHKFFRPMTAHPAWVKAYHSLSPELSAMSTCGVHIIFRK